jgi:hypothetical protein
VCVGEVLAEETVVHDDRVLVAALGRWLGARACQEAGPTGFALQRALLAAGIDTVVVALGLVPSRPGDRLKTDKRAAHRLAGLHAAGLITEVFVPTPEHEALRDLVRAGRMPDWTGCELVIAWAISRRFQEIVASFDATLIRPDRKGEKPQLGKLGGIGQWIDSVYNTTKSQLSLEDQGERTSRTSAHASANVLAPAAGVSHSWQLWEAGIIHGPGRTSLTTSTEPVNDGIIHLGPPSSFTGLNALGVDRTTADRHRRHVRHRRHILAVCRSRAIAPDPARLADQARYPCSPSPP